MMAEGQVHGGVVHGIGNALFEWMGYDAEAQPVTMTLADYLLPTAADVPPLVVELAEYRKHQESARREGDRRSRHRSRGRGDHVGDRGCPAGEARAHRRNADSPAASARSDPRGRCAHPVQQRLGVPCERWARPVKPPRPSEHREDHSSGCRIEDAALRERPALTILKDRFRRRRRSNRPRKLSGKRTAGARHSLERGASAPAEGITFSGKPTVGAANGRREAGAEMLPMSTAEASAPTLLQTPLHRLHVECGARMVPFAGYEMPVQYPDGILKEHQHTRSRGRAVRRVAYGPGAASGRTPARSKMPRGRWKRWSRSTLLALPRAASATRFFTNETRRHPRRPDDRAIAATISALVVNASRKDDGSRPSASATSQRAAR